MTQLPVQQVQDARKIAACSAPDELGHHAKALALAVRELASYTGGSDPADLHAILDRHADEETADIRRILTRRAA